MVAPGPPRLVDPVGHHHGEPAAGGVAQRGHGVDEATPARMHLRAFPSTGLQEPASQVPERAELAEQRVQPLQVLMPHRHGRCVVDHEGGIGPPLPDRLQDRVPQLRPRRLVRGGLLVDDVPGA
ncbi:hypothetical protein Asp14428_73620 [Actinoplanes sp. NBRC 14428]|nr:hypothetical protein Asp14428_73620 [Actinoplanes sp. NBRC 14428]